MDEVYVPVLHYFENGNPFTGSSGNLRFLLTPKEEIITATIWRGIFCLEKSEVECTRDFPLTQEGRTELQQWLQEIR